MSIFIIEGGKIIISIGLVEQMNIKVKISNLINDGHL